MAEYDERVCSLIDAADERIRSLVAETPLEQLVGLPVHSEINTFIKLENLLPAGSFKLRGVTNKLSLLSDSARKAGVVAASSGNHGAGLAYAVQQLGGKGLIFVPEYASPSKVQVIESLGASVRFIGEDSVETECIARQYANENSLSYISPYNDIDIIAGQGTIACELCRQKPGLDAVFVALGGGGLTSGIASYLKKVSPSTQIIACSPTNSKVMMESVAAGEILELASKKTFSDGTAGGIEAGSVTFEYCSQFIDRFVEVSEYEIACAVSYFINARRLLVEGAAGVAIAALLKTQDEWRHKNVAIIICGGNVDAKMLKQMLLIAGEQGNH